MAGSNKTISYTIDIGADITKARQAAAQLQSIFSKSFGQNSNKGMFNLFSGLDKALDTLEQRSSKKITSIADANALKKAKEDVIDYFSAIEREGKKIGNLGGVDFKKRLEGLGTQISEATRAWNTFESAQKSNSTQAEKSATAIQKQEEAVEQLEKALKKLEDRQAALSGRGGELTTAKSQATRAENLLKSAQGSLGAKTRATNQAEAAYNNYMQQNDLVGNKTKDRATLGKSFGLITEDDVKIANQYLRTIKTLTKDIAKAEKTPGTDLKYIENLKKQLDQTKQTTDDFLNNKHLQLTPTGEIDQAAKSQYNENIKQQIEDTLTGAEKLKQTWDEAAASQQNAQKEVAKLAKEAESARAKADAKQSEFDSNTEQIKELNDTLTQSQQNISDAKKELADFIKTAADSNFKALKDSLSQVFGDEFVADIDNTEEGLEKLKQKLNQVGDEKIAEGKQRLEELFATLDKAGSAGQAVEGMSKKVDDGVDSVKRLTDTQQDIENLINRFKYFFSLAGGFQLMRRAIRSAIDTTKELDAVMTQTAVVSDYTVGDMWKTLPEYSKQAKQLGSAISDVYSAQTLYVQQGLNMNDALDLGIETLKMARVANIEAGQATDYMTSALRGFNMELNETSAVRINDVYSKLAQNTASDVQEISVAMSKTAALANSANMSFENTAAFLAQIIESTREGAETAGTALKTVIARFTEVKKLYSEGELLGTTEEGEEVDVNKISKALRTAGINLNEFFTGTKGLDDIFIELASKWSGLTTVQQRYIATMAAGSRQQSRFLALMQDYSRTVELTQMAYNSAGSGQEQFEKTLDSLEVKLAKLKAEWDTFTMGIANSDFIKGAIDAGTKILELLNSIIDKISGGNGAIKSVTSLAAAFGVFKGGKEITKYLLGGIGKLAGLKVGEDTGKGFLKSFQNTIKQASEGTKSAVAKDFLSNYFKDSFVPLIKKQTLSNIDFGNLRLSLQDSMPGAQTFSADMGDQFNAYQATVKQFGYDSQEAIEKYNELSSAAQKAGISQEQFGEIMQKNSTYTQESVVNFKGLANSALMVGGIFIGLASVIDQLSGKSTIAGKVIRSLGVGFVVLGAGIKIATAATAAFGVALEATPIGWIITAIAAIAAIGTALYQLIPTAEKTAKKLKEFAETASDGAEQVRNSYESVKGTLEDLDGKEDALDEITKGTEEWDLAVQSLNQSILELIKLYPELAAAVKYVDGHLSLDKESAEYQQWIEDLSNAAKNSYIASNAAQIASVRSNKEAETNIGFRQIYEEGLASAFKVFGHDITSISDEVINLLEEDIKNLAINDKETLRAALGSERYNLSDEEQRTIYNVLGGGVSTPANWQQIEFNSRYFENVIAALSKEGEYNKAFKGLSTQTIVEAMDQSGYKNSQFSSMYYSIGERIFKDVYDNIDEKLIDSQADIYKSELSKALNVDIDQIPEEVLREYSRQKITEKQLYNSNTLAEDGSFIETNFGKFQNAFNKMSSENKILASALITGQTSQLTLDQLNELGSFDYNNLFGLEKISQDEARKLYTKLFEENTKYQPQIEKVASTQGQAEKYINIIDQITKNGGNVTDFFEDINTILEKTPDNKKDQVKDILSATDFGNRSSIRNAVKQLNELGIEIDSNFTNQIITATKAVAKFNLKSLEEQISSLESGKSAVQKLADGETNITAKEYADLSLILPDFNPDDWVRTGLDEYTYIGEETNSLLASINAAVSQLVAENIEQTNEDISKGQQIETILEDKIYRGRGDEGITVNEAIEKLAVDPKSLNEAALSQLRAKFNLSSGTSAEEILDYYNKYYGAEGVAFQGNQEKLAGRQTYAEVGYNQSSAQYLLNQAATGDESASRALEAQVINNDLLLKVEDYGKKFGLTAEEINKSKDALNALAVIANKTEKSIDGLNTALSNDFQTLKEAKKGTTAYNTAMTNILKAAKKVFGDDTTSEWIEEHIDKFEALAQGGEEAETAFKDLSKIKADQVFKKIQTESKFTDDALEVIQKHWNELNGSNLEVGSTADFSNILSEMQLTEDQANKLAEYLNSIPDLSVVWQQKGTKTINGVDVPIGTLKVTKTGASGSGIPTSPGGGGGGGGGGNKEFKNDFDKYYNLVEDSNELERLRNLLETDYQQLLEAEQKSGQEIYNNLKRQIELLRERAAIEADLAEKRKQQIIDTMNSEDYSDLQKYAWWNDEDKTLEIDWDLINTVKDSEEGDRIKEYLQKMEGFQSQYDEAIQALEDIESTIQEIEKRGREQYISLEDRVRDALIKQIQDKIDELTAVDEAINDANQRLIDSINQELELQRQNRDNEKTEKELSDKEQRLAYLRQDSSGANALEIAQLEKELAEGREDYTDQLIDQKISELQRQNEEAADQRRQQIDLMQKSLDWQEKNGEFWDQVYDLIGTGIGPDGTLAKGSDLEKLLKGGEGFTGLSNIGQMDWLKELQQLVAQAVAYLSMSRQLENIGAKEGTEITFTDANGQTHVGTIDDKGNVVVVNPDGSKTIWTDVYQDYDGKYRTLEKTGKDKDEPEPAVSTKNPPSPAPATEEKKQQNYRDYDIEQENGIWKVVKKPNNGKWYTPEAAQAEADRLNALLINQNPDLYYQKKKKKNNPDSDHSITKYATGGLNTETGLAWLDGTPSKPELILNARDTQNFIQLRDVLSDLQRGAANNTFSGGDNYYDIDVHVDQMSSDYDVDRAIDRIKTRLYQDGAYRNVNTLSRLR